MFLALRFPSIKPSPNLSQLLLLSPSSHFFVSLSMKDSKSTTAKVGVVVEYAKSGRSSCKKCLKPIANGSLRLGSSFKNPSGFDMIKWHHLCCFSKESWTDVGDVEEIKGFSSLKVLSYCFFLSIFSCSVLFLQERFDFSVLFVMIFRLGL